MKFNADEKFLFQEKTVSAFLFIYQKEVTYISEVAANIESTFAHTNKIIKRLESIGFLSSVFEGRSRFLKLTPKGYAFAQKLSEAFEVCQSGDVFNYPEGYEPTRKIETAEFDTEADASFLTERIEQSGSAAKSDAKSNIKSDSKEKSGSKIKIPDGPLSTADRIKLFGLRIKEVYDELIENESDKTTFLRRLGPFDRELKLIGSEIEKLDSEDESVAELQAAYRAAEMQYSFYLGKE